MRSKMSNDEKVKHLHGRLKRSAWGHDPSKSYWTVPLVAHIDYLTNTLGQQAGWVEFADYWLRRETTWHVQGIIGLTVERFAQVYDEQHGRCGNPFCGGSDFLGINDPNACADHCHVTRKFRGILCSDCNVIEGKLRLERRVQQMPDCEKNWFEKYGDKHIEDTEMLRNIFFNLTEWEETNDRHFFGRQVLLPAGSDDQT